MELGMTEEEILAPENTEKLKRIIRTPGDESEADTEEKPYTVVGFYPEDTELWVSHVMATSRAQAMQKAVLDMVEPDGTPCTPDECTLRCVLAMFAGHHKEISNLEVALNAEYILQPDRASEEWEEYNLGKKNL